MTFVDWKTERNRVRLAARLWIILDHTTHLIHAHEIFQSRREIHGASCKSNRKKKIQTEEEYYHNPEFIVSAYEDSLITPDFIL